MPVVADGAMGRKRMPRRAEPQVTPRIPASWGPPSLPSKATTPQGRKPRKSRRERNVKVIVSGRGKKAFPVSENSEKKTTNFSSISGGGWLNSRAQGKMDNIIEARELQIERKHFYVELRENERGKFLRITEEAHGRRNSIIVPSTGVEDFTATIAEVLTNGQGAPA